jgi:hypothetical protein
MQLIMLSWELPSNKKLLCLSELPLRSRSLSNSHQIKTDGIGVPEGVSLLCVYICDGTAGVSHREFSGHRGNVRNKGYGGAEAGGEEIAIAKP